MNAKKTEKGEEENLSQKSQSQRKKKQKETSEEEESSNEQFTQTDREPRLRETSDKLRQEYDGESFEEVEDRSRKYHKRRPRTKETRWNSRVSRGFNTNRQGNGRQNTYKSSRRNLVGNTGVNLRKNVLRNKLTMNKYFTDNSISHNTSIETPMPWMKVSEVPLDGIDGIKVTGTEYVTSIGVRTTGTGATVYTTQGDFIYSQPLHPKFFSGTRLLALARLYQKYKFQKLIFEYVPLVPSTQDGALIMYVQYDVEENISVISDPETKLRETMSHLGAKMFNVYTYGRSHLEDDHQIKMYDFETGNDPRLENQGAFNILAASSFGSPSGEQVDVVLGQILVHYELDLFERGLTDDPSETVVSPVSFSGTVTNAFTNIDPVTTGPLVFNKSFISTVLGFNPKISDLIIFKVSQTLLVGAGTPVNKVQGRTQNHGDSSPLFLFEKGSVWYIYPWVDQPDKYMAISDSLDTAMVREKDFNLNSALTGTNVISCAGTFYVYSLEH
jgi:hypothetical protein